MDALIDKIMSHQRWWAPGHAYHQKMKNISELLTTTLSNFYTLAENLLSNKLMRDIQIIMRYGTNLESHCVQELQ